jgi:hypothetical protein
VAIPQSTRPATTIAAPGRSAEPVRTWVGRTTWAAARPTEDTTSRRRARRAERSWLRRRRDTRGDVPAPVRGCRGVVILVVVAWNAEPVRAGRAGTATGPAGSALRRTGELPRSRRRYSRTLRASHSRDDPDLNRSRHSFVRPPTLLRRDQVTVRWIFLSRGPSHSQRKIVCNSPSTSSPSCRGIATEEAVSAERTCAHGLRSPTSECLHFHDSSTSRSSAASISAATLLAPARLLGGRCRRWCAARRTRPPAHSLPSAPRAPSAVMSTSCVRRSVCTTSVRIGEGSVRSPHEQLALCEPTAEAIELRRPVEMARGNSEGRVELVQMPATDVAAPVCSTNFN